MNCSSGALSWKKSPASLLPRAALPFGYHPHLQVCKGLQAPVQLCQRDSLLHKGLRGFLCSYLITDGCLKCGLLILTLGNAPLRMKRNQKMNRRGSEAEEKRIMRKKCGNREEEIQFGTCFLWRQSGEKEKWEV